MYTRSERDLAVIRFYLDFHQYIGIAVDPNSHYFSPIGYRGNRNKSAGDHLAIQLRWIRARMPHRLQRFVGNCEA